MGCGKFDLAKADFGWKIDGSSRLAEWGFDEGIDSEGKWDGIASGQVEPRGPYIAYLEERGLRLTHVEDMLRRQSSRLAAFPTPLPDDAYCDNWIAGIGLRLIASAPRHKPWFLQVNFAGPHDPWDITAAMAEMYRGINFPLPPGLNPGQAEAHLAVRQNYAAMIENIDRWLGVFLNTLQENGQFSETLVVVSSDHGEMLGDRGCWGKTVPCQGSLAVPLAISGPGVSQAAVVRSPTTILDLAATFLDFAGAAIPSAWDTRSIRKQLEDPEAPPPRRYVYSGLPRWQLVFDGRFKLVATQNGTELYDLMNDPSEATNVAAFEPARVGMMSALLRQRRS